MAFSREIRATFTPVRTIPIRSVCSVLNDFGEKHRKTWNPGASRHPRTPLKTANEYDNRCDYCGYVYLDTRTDRRKFPFFRNHGRTVRFENVRIRLLTLSEPLAGTRRRSRVHPYTFRSFVIFSFTVYRVQFASSRRRRLPRIVLNTTFSQTPTFLVFETGNIRYVN